MTARDILAAVGAFGLATGALNFAHGYHSGATGGNWPACPSVLFAYGFGLAGGGGSDDSPPA